MTTTPTHTAPAPTYDAVILDLDGVITDTASLHARAWEATFNTYLHAHHPDQPPFDPASDYTQHIDGKPRLTGVRDFLASRRLTPPEGSPADTITDATVLGIANTKNTTFHTLLNTQGPRLFDDALRAINHWHTRNIPLAVVSSSRNCKQILESVDLLSRFAARVDGTTCDHLHIPGKPDPAMFLEAAKRLSVPPSRCAIVEDAIAGVQAGHAGNFAHVVGIDRTGTSAQALLNNGATTVITSLNQLLAAAL